MSSILIILLYKFYTYYLKININKGDRGEKFYLILKGSVFVLCETKKS